MRPVLVYPLPFDAYETFEPNLYRFAYTLKQFPPGCDYELVVMCNWGEPDAEVRRLFRNSKTRFINYYEHGCDIGSAQVVGRLYPDDAFIMALTSRCYFHREGWLRRLVEARGKHGPGLYGPFASWESGKPHICTRGYCMDGELWKAYPHVIDSRPKGQRFEVGDWCLTDWIRDRGLPAVQVLWDNEQTIKDWRKWDGAFRSGAQNACLIWDKHTDAFRDATPEQKARLKAMCDVPSYSQHGEDRWIFENLDLPVRGTFVEVGAHDGITGSNTLLFERMGWKGFCVEADPFTAMKCMQNRSSVYEMAIGSVRGHREFNVNEEDHGLSGFNRPGKPTTVAVHRLDELLQEQSITELDLLSIDTEGTELDVWASLWGVKPRIVIIEYQTCEEQPQEIPIRAALEGEGYSLAHRTPHNLIFTR